MIEKLTRKFWELSMRELEIIIEVVKIWNEEQKTIYNEMLKQ
jgi:hypothetical protein